MIGAHRACGTHARRRGFTLMELVVVLMLLGLLATVSVPALRAVDATETAGEATARRLATLLRRLQRTAVERGTVATLRLSPATGRYRVEVLGDDGAAVLEDSVLHVPGGATLQLDGATTTTATTTASGDVAALARWDATPRGGIAGPALVVRDGARAHRVVVDGWTAEVRVHAP